MEIICPGQNSVPCRISKQTSTVQTVEPIQKLKRKRKIRLRQEIDVEVKIHCHRPADSRSRSKKQLESAPVPIAGNAGRDLSSLAEVGFEGSTADLFAGGKIFSVLSLTFAVLRIHGILDLAQAVGASLFPTLVCAPAEVTGSRRNTIRVETSMLVKGNHVRGVRRAKDVAAMTAMVAT